MEAGIHLYSREAESQMSLDFRTASFLAQTISAKVLKSQHFVIVGKVPNFQHHVVSLKELYLQHLIYIFCGSFSNFCGNFATKKFGNFSTKRVIVETFQLSKFLCNFPAKRFLQNFFKQSKFVWKFFNKAGSLFVKQFFFQQYEIWKEISIKHCDYL